MGEMIKRRKIRKFFKKENFIFWLGLDSSGISEWYVTLTAEKFEGPGIIRLICNSKECSSNYKRHEINKCSLTQLQWLKNIFTLDVNIYGTVLFFGLVFFFVCLFVCLFFQNYLDWIINEAPNFLSQIFFFFFFFMCSPLDETLWGCILVTKRNVLF